MVSWDLFALFKNQFKDGFVHKADPKEQIVPITILYAVTTKSLAASSKMRHAGTGNAFAGDRCTRFNAEKTIMTATTTITTITGTTEERAFSTTCSTDDREGAP